MIKNRYTALIAAIIIAGLAFFILKRDDKKPDIPEEFQAYRGMIKTLITTTGTVLPRNRLEIKPPLAGRVDKILFYEGQIVRAGTVIAYMSSNERAALIDAARASGDESVKYWNEAYKPIPIVTPITGTVIVRPVEPGQTVTTGTAILVLSDRLIVKADVDETDIGRVRVGQKTIITLDAYAGIRAPATVSHISYESKIINNVTMYEVDILPDKTPEVFRSGMSANVDIIESIKENALIVPLKAVYNDNGNKYVLLKMIRSGKEEIEKRIVKTGISGDSEIEISDGLREKDTVLVKIIKIDDIDPDSQGTNPFRPRFKKKK